MQIVLAIKRVDKVHEAALIIDNKFTRSATSASASDLLTRLLGPVLSIDRGDGVEIAINVAILTAAEVERMEARVTRERKIDEARQEAEQLETLNQARKREEAARGSDQAAG